MPEAAPAPVDAEPPDTDPPARPAATVVVMRASPRGPEVLLLKRARGLGFFPNAWVFPGGRVDPADAVVATRGAVAGLASSDQAFAVAAIRECFEETGVWLGQGSPAPGLRQALVQRQGNLGLDPDLVADLDALRLWSWWITPRAEPRRYDTRFFLSCLPPGVDPQVEPDGHETIDAIWIRPAQAVARAEIPQFFMAPPTFRTLEELALHPSIPALWAAAGARRIRAIEPRMRRDLPGTDGWAVLLPGDPEHPDPEPVEGPSRIVLRGGRWINEG